MSGRDLQSGIFIGRGVLVQLLVATGVLCLLLFGCGFLVGAFWFEAFWLEAERGRSVERVEMPAFETYEPEEKAEIEPISASEPGPELVAETTPEADHRLESGTGAPWVAGPTTARERSHRPGRTERPGPAIDRPFGSLETIELPAFRAEQETPGSPFRRAIRRVAREQGVSPLLVTAVVAVESSFNANTVSNKGAMGLMQLMPDTARRFGVDPDDLFDPYENLRAGCSYLRWLAERFDDDPVLVLAAYNAGEGAVDTYGGVPPYPETQNFVRKVYRELGWESVQPIPLGSGRTTSPSARGEMDR